MSQATAQPIATGDWTIDKVHSHVGFAVKHMVVATFRAQFDDYSGTLAVGESGQPSLRGTVKADSIVVKDENLAAHLRAPDFFDTERFPEIGFESSAITLGEHGELEVEGELTIKDHSHRVTARGAITGPHTDLGGNEKLGVELEAVIDRREYGLEFNAELPKGGYAVDNDVRLEVSLELVKEA
ncbi:MAG TPA: YceI family protein [Solirubrobacteraceae bacterium]|nr:YceI family protein [Solirubrobacteraceae bacterium]